MDAKRYTGTKTLDATPMTKGAYCAYRGWTVPANEDADEAGMLVEYTDGGKANDARHKGYISWSPLDVFERTYKPVDAAPFNVDAAIAATPAPKVTMADIEAVITGKTFHRLTETLTVCVVGLRNGFTVTGESACASPENYNQEIGEALAYKDAVSKVWALEAYLLREEMYALDCEDYECQYSDRVAEYRAAKRDDQPKLDV